MSKSQVVTLKDRLKKVVDGFNDLKESGIDEELLIAWIHYRTKMSIKNIKRMLNTTEEFYEKLVKEEMLDTLQKEDGGE